MSRAALLAMAAAALLAPRHALAQADPTTIAETERLKAETDLENARTNRIKADNDRITAIGIPKFDGKTDVGTTGGAMEATLLSAQALGGAADSIATDDTVKSQASVVVLTKDETLDLGLAASMQFEMDTINALYTRAKVDDVRELGGGVGPAAVLTTIAGLLRSDVTLSYADAAPIDDRMLAWSVARGLGAKAVLPSARIGGGLGDKGKELFKTFNLLELRRDLAVARRDELAGNKAPTEAEKTEVASLNSAIARHDAFVTRATTPSDKGIIPFLAAARRADLLTTGNTVLRVHVDKAGGSLVNRKDITTFFGADPLRISGGIVVSWILTDPDKGSVLAADVLTCRTTNTTIPKVQSFAKGTTGAVCRSVLPAAISQ